MTLYKLLLRDEREGWMPYLGRRLAEAVLAERLAEDAYRKAMAKRREIENSIVSLGELINRRLGPPEEKKACLDGEIERIPAGKQKVNGGAK